MPRDIEAELRRSLQARATDITPDPALYSRVQARIRRGRTFRFAFAGLATAMVIAGVAVAAPRMIDRVIEFEPGPGGVATQPAPEPTATPPEGTKLARPPSVFSDGESVFFQRDEESAPELLVKSRGSVADVAVRPTSPDRLELVYSVTDDASALSACGRLDLFRREADGSEGTLSVVQGDPRGAPGPDCPSSPMFSPDGRHLAWLARSEIDDSWSIETADLTEDGLGTEDAGFGLPWPADQPVDIQDWVWEEQTATTASGFLVVRTQRNGGWMLLKFPIERQGDGALAVGPGAAPITSMTGDDTPVAFASGGGDFSRDEDTTYVMEINMARAGIEGGRIVRRVGAETGGVLDLPPELFNSTNPPFDVADLWMSAAGDILVYGNSGPRMAWGVDWSTAEPDRWNVWVNDSVQAIVAGDLLMQAAGEPPIGDGEIGGDDGTQAQTAVEVYFGMTGADACVADQPVTRVVEGAGVARAAITELLEGPNSRESNEGITSPFSANTAGALNDIKIVDGQAQVDFDDFSADVGNDSCTKSAIEDSLNKTLFQFETITSTLYSFNGDFEAWNTWLGLDSETPPAPVVDTQKAIYAAALGHDWAALRQLSAETSCTLSDQKEPCVPYWKEQEANGEDPLGTLVDLLEMPAAKMPDSPMWVWPEEWAAGEGYNGPRIGIDEDGVWRYYVQQGG